MKQSYLKNLEDAMYGDMGKFTNGDRRSKSKLGSIKIKKIKKYLRYRARAKK